MERCLVPARVHTPIITQMHAQITQMHRHVTEMHRNRHVTEMHRHRHVLLFVAVFIHTNVKLPMGEREREREREEKRASVRKWCRKQQNYHTLGHTATHCNTQ